MVSLSTLFHPIALDLLIIPIAISLGVFIVYITKRIALGIVVTLLSLSAFDIWFWYYYYSKDGVSLDDTILFYSLSSIITWLLSKILLNKTRSV